MPKAILHRANERGYADHGWLQSYHSFSFANYFDPQKINFGALRVLNDDTVAAGRGFGTHRHDNMEIISIPLQGDLEHKDSMGNIATIRSGDIQAMSAGTGISHSEYNRSKDHLVKFLQIWIIPNQRDVTPRYDQITLDKTRKHNKLLQILSPFPDDEGVWINQKAWFHLGRFDENFDAEYQLKDIKNGVYAFVINGSFDVNDVILQQRDGLGLLEIQSLKIKSLTQGSEILLMEVPMI
jgi:hypothetical protein